MLCYGGKHVDACVVTCIWSNLSKYLEPYTDGLSTMNIEYNE